MKKIITEEFWVYSDGAKHYHLVEKLVSDDEYYYRKYYETTPHGNMDKIFEAYRDYCESRRWD